ncbi:MAG TPA: fused MFS/spermidine synthase [Nitriliruptorales bacterium]|nr:fused MFS/spermidine synthase [Nitriliruptorales bacterium]
MTAGGGGTAPSQRPVDGPPGWRRQLHWVLLAFLPSSLMLGVTHFVSTDIAAFPLLWVVPLALYLLTFVVAFGQPRPRLALHADRLLPAAVLAVAIAMVTEVPIPPGLEIGLHLLMFTTVALGAHGRLAADRPHPARLTHFYLLVSVGGALGGLFNALVAPVVFEQVLEYPLVIVASTLVLLGRHANRVASRSRPLSQRLFEAQAVVGVLLLLQQVVVRLGAMAAIVLVGVSLGARAAVARVARRRPLGFTIGIALVLASAVPLGTDVLHAERTFFGVARVEAQGDRRLLVHGTTIHGWQDRRPDHSALPKSYYDRRGPVGDVFEEYGHRPLADQVALVGLGTGALAAFGRSGQTLTFYEIDQAIVDIATDPELFTYLRDSAAEIEVVLGDGRLSLRDAPDDHFGIIVIDGFSSDAIPVHLVTAEAVDLYRSKLRPDGVLVFHVSNRHMDLEPVLAAIATRQDLSGVVRSDVFDAGLGEVTWVALAEDHQSLAPLIRDPRWRRLVTEPGEEPVWTDDFSNVVQVIRWR